VFYVVLGSPLNALGDAILPTLEALILYQNAAANPLAKKMNPKIKFFFADTTFT